MNEHPMYVFIESVADIRSCINITHLTPPSFSLGVCLCFAGQQQFGGNAQAITKGRWLHHTSFLWDFDPANMLYLQMPDKRVRALVSLRGVI